jgi:hypothetical protein
MAIGRISGSVLKSNLTRNGVDLAFETNLLYLDVTNSRVGIGTSEPATTFHVNGTIRGSGINVNNAYTLPTSDGSAGQQLTTDGSGTVTWADKEGSSNISFSGTTMASDGALTLDATTDITLDAGGADILLKDDGTAFGGFSNSSTDLVIKAGTTPTTVLTLSSSGQAQFENISISDNIITTTASNSNLELKTAGSGTVLINDADAIYGKIGGTNFTNSIIVGHADSGSLSSAERNTAMGLSALDSLTSGTDNTVIGYAAGTAINTGVFNTIYGTGTGESISGGGYNTALGGSALGSLTTSSANTAVGYDALNVATGHGNTALGKDALKAVSNASYNIGIGQDAGENITSGSGNVVIGTVDVDTATGNRQLLIAGWDGSNRTTWIKGTSGGAITFNGAFTFPTADGSANQVLQTDGSGNISWATVSVDSLATGGITYDDNKITGQRSNENIEIEANGSGVIETGSSILPKTDNSVDLGSSSKRFKEGYFAAGTVHIGDQTIKSTASGFVFSGGISTSGKQVTANDDTTSTIINKKGLGTSEATVESYATSAFDSSLYYIVSRDEVNDMITAQKVTMVHNNSTGFASTSHVTKTGSSTDMSFDGSVSGGSMRLRATGGSFSNSLSAYKIALGDNSSAGTSGNTAIVINADVDSATENLDTWAHASYRGAKYFISVNDEADDELETLEAMVTHNGTDAFITVYNNVRTGSTGLITLTADISGANVRLRGAGSRANLNVKMHRILLSDSETAYTGDQMAIIPATTISSSATAIDTFNVNNVNGAFYYVTSTIANGDSCMAELVVATNGTDAYATTGPIISSEGTDQLSFTATISGDIVTISAASSSGGSTTVNAYRINLKRDAEADVANTVLLSGAQTISGNKTFTDSTELKFGSDGDANIKHTGTNLNIQETTGDINLRTYANDKDVIISTDDGSGGITEYLVADGSTGAVKLKHYGTTVFETTTTGASITNTSTDDALLVTTTEDSNTAGPVISLKRNSSSPADADYLGQIKFKGENDNDQEVNYAKITGKILDASDGSEDGILEFAFMKNGSQNISGRFRSDSLQLLNDTSLRVSGHVELGVLASDPSGTTDHAHIYAKDDSSSAEVFVRDEAGNVTKLSPHNEKGNWEYYSKNVKTGKVVRIDMEEMIKDLEQLTGKKYIKEE